jgi:hypothetical protein
MDNAVRKILQIIPSDGWSARFEEDDGLVHDTPLVCWALTGSFSRFDDSEATESRNVVGVCASPDMGYTDFVDESDNFQRYVHISEKG